MKLMPDQSFAKGRERSLRERGGGMPTHQDSQVQPSRSEGRKNYEQWLRAQAQEIVRGK